MSRVRLLGRRIEPRRGAAAAEMAICLPLMVMLVLGSIETCSMIYLRHSLTIASYEAARVAIDFDGTNTEVMARCQEILDAREVADADIDIEPGDVEMVRKRPANFDHRLGTVRLEQHSSALVLRRKDVVAQDDNGQRIIGRVAVRSRAEASSRSHRL